MTEILSSYTVSRMFLRAALPLVRWCLWSAAALSGMMLFRYSTALVATPLDEASRLQAERQYSRVVCLRDQLMGVVPRGATVFLQADPVPQGRAAALIWPWATPTIERDAADLVVLIEPTADAGVEFSGCDLMVSIPSPPRMGS